MTTTVALGTNTYTKFSWILMCINLKKFLNFVDFEHVSKYSAGF
jgi:hypothetical protein